MTRKLSHLRKTVHGLAVVCTLGAGTSGAAWAQSGIAEMHALPVLVSSAAGIGTARFDWLAKRVTKTAAEPSGKAKKTVIAGRGSYICSPAGFGRKSHCSSAR